MNQRHLQPPCPVFLQLLVLICLVAAAPCQEAAATQTKPPSGFGVKQEPPKGPKQEKKVRRLEADSEGRSRRPVVQELQADDDVLEIEDWQPAGLAPAPPPGETPLTMLTRRSSVVAIVTISAIQGQLTDDGRGVRSLVESRIVRALRQPSSGALIRSNDVLSFITPGGSVKLRHPSGREQEVRHFRSGNVPFQLGETYLVFAQPVSGSLFVSPSGAALVGDDALRPLSRSGAAWASESKDVVVNTVVAVALAK